MNPKTIYEKDSDHDGLTDAHKRSCVMAWNFDTMKETLSEMEKDDYQEFIKAFLSLELSISDRTILNQVYQDYMGEDDLSFNSDELRVKVDGYLDEVQSDINDIL